ncbi:MAG: HRDC-like protein [Monoraphidium minutum]|nr:MAG: HRDC-like protein [Monoraphidium minutum]
MDAQRDAAGEEVDEFLKDASIQGVKHAEPLTNQEVSILLDRYRHSNQQSTPGFCPPPMVTKTQAYLDQVAGAVGKNAEAAQAIRDRLVEHGIEGVEMALLANLMPETAEEAYAMVPSLKRKEGLSQPELQELLEQLHSFRQFH